MNIYIHLEIAARELDSKLLLAVLSASRGHRVMISDMAGFNIGLKNKLIKPGIFFTKSLTPSKSKIKYHQNLINKGFVITSIDEEHGLLEDDYKLFAKARFSDETIKQASAVFAWGPKDSKDLKELFPEYSFKIHETGSPRVDLWKTNFFDYWKVPKKIPKKPFLLIASNLPLANNTNALFEIVKSEKKAGYYLRDPSLFKEKFTNIIEDYRLLYDFIQAIEYLSKYSKGFDIVVRPHPVENVECWKTFLQDIPKVHVVREGSISPWVKNSFAVMHNGCTTAIEATISKKPVLTYVTFEQKNTRMLGANKIGIRIESPEDLLKKVNELFENHKLIDKIKYEKDISQTIPQLMYSDSNDLSAQKIIRIWESLTDQNISQFSELSFYKFKFLLKINKFRTTIKNLLRKFFSFNKSETKIENYKIPPFKYEDIQERVKKLQNLLGIKTKIECEFLSERTIQLKKARN